MRLLERLDELNIGQPTRGMCFFGGGGAAGTTIPIAPPQSLFPGLTSTLSQEGSGALSTATSAMEGIASGADVQKIYNAMNAAGQQQEQTGRANVMASMGSSGMASSSDAMRSTQQFENQFQANMLQNLSTLSLQNEQLQLGGAEGLMNTYGNAAMTFAPTQAVVGTTGSIFSQVSSAATGGALAAAAIMAQQG